MHLHKPSPTGVIALLALFLALGGTAIAAHHYLITSTSQIKPSVLKKLKGNTGPAGPAGAIGPAGASGPQGPAGPVNLSALTSVTGATVEVPPGEIKGASAFCPAGSRAVSGGGFASLAGTDVSGIGTEHQSWFIIINNERTITLNIHAEVQCAGAGQAVAASVPRAKRERAERHVQQLVAQLRAVRVAAEH
jgi:hypothetical protein